MLPLGRLAGESATEVGSIIRLVESLSGLTPGQITDPALISASQSTVELDEVLFPMNKKSRQKEPYLWPNELRQQGVAQRILSAFQRVAVDSHQVTLRAKKAVACLLYISGRPMQEVEQTMTQLGGAFDGAAGPIRSAAARTADVLPTGARVSEILYPGLDLGDRVSRLTLRLTYGIPSAAVDLAHEAGNNLLRGDYTRLAQQKLCEPAAIQAATDAALLACVDSDVRKLRVIRDAAEKVHDRRERTALAAMPVLEPYAA